jgi:hypothetical protein
VRPTATATESFVSDGYLLTEGAFAGPALDELRLAVEESCARIVETARSKPKEVVFGGAVAFSEIPELGIRNLVWEGAGLDVPKVVEPMTQVDPRLLELWSHPLLTGLAKMALGVDAVGPLTDKFNAKQARAGGEFLWHQDHPFWYSIIRGEARDTVTLGVYLDDATKANGALVIVPGTQGGPLPRRTAAEDVMARYHADDSRIDTSRAVVAEGPAGSVLTFGPFLLHRSDANHTDGDRRMLLLTFQPAGRARLADYDYESALLSEQWMDELP